MIFRPLRQESKLTILRNGDKFSKLSHSTELLQRWNTDMSTKRPRRPRPPAPDAQAPTRERLLDAALDIFAEHEYNAASTRMLAARAGVNLGAITYHFRDKEGLYLAIIDRILGFLGQKVMPTLSRIEAELDQGRTGRERAGALLRELLTVKIRTVCGAPETAKYSRIILREQLQPTAAYDRIYHGYMERLLRTLSRLAAILADVPEPEATVRAVALLGQILIFRIGREAVVRLTGVSGYSPAEVELLCDVILRQSEAALAPSPTTRPRSKPRHHEVLP